MEIGEFRSALDSWLDEYGAALVPERPARTIEEEMAHLATVRRLVFDAGWARYGWPERVGGLGGSGLLRAYLGEALTARDLVEPGIYSMPEVLVPTMIDFAPESLSAEVVPRLLRGDEVWCQGFSEPGTGSNLSALTCRATATDEGWRVSGQKVWTSLAQFSARCVLLTRTGDAASAHRGITGLFVDMDTPGITVRPLETMHGLEEFSEVFFDDVLVPFDRTLGARDDGWSIAMDLLPYERSSALWHRAAFLQRRFDQLLARAAPGALDPRRVGEVAQLLYAFRAQSRSSQRRLAAGGRLGAETSIDKLLLGTAEQAVFDLAAEGLPELMTIDDGPEGTRWRSEFLYSRAATIYGGTAEIQRNIIARRLLDLGRDR